MTEDELWQVVADAQGRHSVWPKDRAVPAGWTPAGFVGPRAACVTHVEAVWTDLVPTRWRRVLVERQERPAHG